MEANVSASVEMDVESQPGGRSGVKLQLFGRMTLWRDGQSVALPASRKVRALIAYLALARRPVARSHLCELLFDVPSDPRGELRWCLSRMRSVLDDDEARRVQVDGERVGLAFDQNAVDALVIARAGEQAAGALAGATPAGIAPLFRGELLEGFELPRQPGFDAWLVAQRRHFRGLRLCLLKQLARASAEDDATAYLEQALDLAPLDAQAHAMLLETLARSGRVRDGEEHLAAATRLFQSEGCPLAPLRDAWRAARARPVAAVSTTLPAVVPRVETTPSEPAPAADRRASIAVMPFAAQSLDGTPGLLGDGLAHDVVTRLAKLRSLCVIAQASTFALRDRGVDAGEAGRLLGVDYLLTGSVRRDATRIVVNVELADTRTSRVVWAEILNHPLVDALAVLDELANSVVASIASEIEALERSRAMLRPPTSLTAWEAHHRGLWHMYRFTRDDNAQARQWFERAVELDPTFARAHAGASFTHFQDAFQGWGTRAVATERAFSAAARSLVADERDPAAHWAFGRAQWLRGRLDDGVAALDESVALSPNFALGHYALAFVNAQSGDAGAAIASCDQARQLSPYDPLLFGMLGARAMALVRLERFDEAADWAVKAAARPNAHAHILALAACSLALAGKQDEARTKARALLGRSSGYRTRDLLEAFRFDERGARLFSQGGKGAGLH